MLSLLGVPLFVQPSARPGLAALMAFLCTEDYCEHARSRIMNHVAHEGTLAGLVDRGLLEPADEALAEQVYVDALEPTPSVSHAWDDPGVWTDLDSFEDALEAAQRRQLSTAFELPPISGGAPTEEHTSGPWSVGDTRSWNGMPMTSVWEIPGSPLALVVALPTRGEANARLIAAAPELLASCKAMVSVLIQFVEVQNKDWFKAAEIAIAKATVPPISGGSPDDDTPRPWRSAAELAEWTRRALREE